MELTIPRRFCGPPESGNGGWVSGALAAFVATSAEHPAVTVRLASPPPLDRPMSVAVDDRPDEAAGAPGGPAVVRLLDGDHLVATATASSDLAEDLPPPVLLEQADGAAARYEGLADHPFPTCFACGTDRDPGDALCLRPGPIGDGSGRYAATWVPREASGPFVWAALDCPGAWAVGIAGRAMVLGTMTARVDALPVVGEPHVVLAWPRGSQGRKHWSGTALLTPGGEVLARAEATWVAVDPATVRPEDRP
ncbi:hypothetical protein GCM10023168_02230 [Fodinibacter luteus]|uniref:Thioesterase family protein n=1 Tax=Fodinibacter luteus TaxID=552064 RepID=A0ABP8JX51_9MICO